MAYYITADLHLSAATANLNRAFLAFIKSKQAGDKVIVAGDLFDFFVGIDKADPAQQTVRAAANWAQAHGVELAFIQGNRDFLLRRHEASSLGLHLLPDFYVIAGPFGNVLIMHGDLLCSNDVNYQRFRRRCHLRCNQSLFMLLPLSLRRKIGAKIRGHSQQANGTRGDERIYGPVLRTIDEVLTRHHCNHLVHGHIHHYAHFSNESAQAHSRLSLGCWGTHYSFVKLDATGLHLVQAPLSSLLT